jgi:hypothetical protein
MKTLSRFSKHSTAFKIIISVLVVAVYMSLALGSGSSTTTPTIPAGTTKAPTSEPTATEAPIKTNVVLGEIAEVSGVQMLVTAVDKSAGSEYDKPKSGMEFVVVHVTIKNASDSTISYNPFNFSMKNSQGQILDQTITFSLVENTLNSGELLPGGVVSGEIPFEMPKDDAALIFIYEDVGLFSDKVINIDISKTAATIETLTQDAIKVDGEQIVNVGEENKLDDTTVTMVKVVRSAGNSFDKPKAGKEFIIVTVLIKNGGTGTISYNPYDFKMRNSQGQQESQTFSTIDSDTALESGELAGGGTVQGTIIFEEPKGDTGLILVYQPNIFLEKHMAFKIS